MSIRYKKNIQIVLILAISVLIMLTGDSKADCEKSQANAPLNIKNTFEKSALQVNDLDPRGKYQLAESKWSYNAGVFFYVVNWEATYSDRETFAASQAGCTFYYNEKPLSYDTWVANYSGSLPSYSQLPYATINDPGSTYCQILVYVTDQVSFRVDVNIFDDNPSMYEQTKGERAEAERLASIVYNRLVSQLNGLPAGISDDNFNDEGADGTLPPGVIDPDNPFPGPALTGPGSDSPISDAALPLAVGAAALVTALGTLGLAFSGGTTPAEAFSELKALLTPNREEVQAPPQTPPADGRDPQEILSDPRLHDQVTDVNGKQWVYYHRPGDLAGVGWTSLEVYNQTLTQENRGKIWTDRYGWQTEEELRNSEQMGEKFAADNQKASIKFNEELKALQSPPAAEQPLAELPSYINGQEREQFTQAVKEATQQFEQETDDILKELVASERRYKESVARSDKLGQEIELEGKKASFALKLAEDTQKLRKDGYWIRNPNNSKTIDKLNLLHSPLDPRGLRCEDAANLRYEEVRKKAVELFGEGVIVDKVVVVESSTIAPKGVVDQLDSILDYNHTAIRVITPDGEAFIVDNWQALQSKGSTRGLMQPEERFIENWRGSLGQKDYHHYSYRDGGGLLDGQEHTLNRYIEEHGSEEGLRRWQADTSRKIEANIKIPDPDKDAYAKQMETLVKYIKSSGEKIGL